MSSCNTCKLERLATVLYRDCNVIFHLLFLACLSSSHKKLHTDENSIQSPFYPDYYTNNEDCNWLVSAPFGKIVRFWFTMFQLGQGDYLELWDNNNDSASIIRNFTSKPDLKDRWTSGRYLWVRFKSDVKGVDLGFNLTWEYVNIPTGIAYSFLILHSEWTTPTKRSRDLISPKSSSVENRVVFCSTMRVDADFEFIVAGSLEGKTSFSRSRTATFEQVSPYLI